MEDEVDWSDSPLGPETPVQEATFHELPLNLDLGLSAYQEHPSFNYADHEQWNLPSGDPLSPHLDQDAGLRPSVSRAQRSKIRVHLNRRKPTREDYSNFVLYQGSQKVYEAVFLKTFLNHALNPNQLETCLPGDLGCYENVQQYLKSVLSDVNLIVNKMIWNTHSRTINLMAHDEREVTPFWDFHQFDKRLFNNFSSGNSTPAVQMMNESWHRAFSPPLMVGYTGRQYPVSLHSSPFEEIDEVTEALFKGRSAAPTAAHDRVARAPYARKNKGRHLPGAALRDVSTVVRNNWLQGFKGSHVTESSDPVRNGKHHLPPNPYSTAEDEIFTGDNFSNDSGASSVENVWNRTIEGTDSVHVDDSGNGCMGDIIAFDSICTSDSHVEKPALLETLEGLHGPNILLQGSVPSSISEDMPSKGLNMKGPSWRTRLIEDHKFRLAAKWPPAQYPGETSLDFTTAVDRAITRGDLKPLRSGLQRITTFANQKEEMREPLQTVRQADVINRFREALEHHIEGSEVMSPHPAGARTISQGEVAEICRAKHPPKESLKKSANASRRQPTDMFSNGSMKQLPKQADKETIKKIRKRSHEVASTRISNKRRKVTKDAKASKTAKPAISISKQSSMETPPLSDGSTSVPIQSGMSKTLEHHQHLPPNAYWEKRFSEELPVWRCGIKHAMGYYYNAGDRKNCAGCFTSFHANPKRKEMDFYLPSRSHYFQPAPGVIWRPSKQRMGMRRSAHLSHNSIAKDAYWAAIDTGATEDEAWKEGIVAVEEHLRPKVPPKIPTPEPTPEPVDLGPHPSGSETMEHGQQIPDGAYFTKEERNDELAWRCDVNHALGRYYYAGDIKSCHGCGSCRSGLAKHTEMDFYLPSGTVVRQEAQHLVKWRPRKPYKLSKISKKDKQIVTHNQICATKYWELVNSGHEPEEAMQLAIKATDAHVEAKNEGARAKLIETSKDTEESNQEHSDTDNAKLSSVEESSESESRNTRVSAHLLSLVPRRQSNEALSDSEREEVTEYETEHDTDQQTHEAISVTSDDESTSDSDSE
ncbi:hypothetical protein N0V90_000560 [Kalmusia sp. IMI 367209]|nr:hypothetical protein N0V90_000560 [Kalmusia sp. IMI 367209]